MVRHARLSSRSLQGMATRDARHAVPNKPSNVAARCPRPSRTADCELNPHGPSPALTCGFTPLVGVQIGVGGGTSPGILWVPTHNNPRFPAPRGTWEATGRPLTVMSSSSRSGERTPPANAVRAEPYRSPSRRSGRGRSWRATPPGASEMAGPHSPTATAGVSTMVGWGPAAVVLTDTRPSVRCAALGQCVGARSIGHSVLAAGSVPPGPIARRNGRSAQRFDRFQRPGACYYEGDEWQSRTPHVRGREIQRSRAPVRSVHYYGGQLAW